MIASGDRLSFGRLEDARVDKHSTGGVGESVRCSRRVEGRVDRRTRSWRRLSAGQLVPLEAAEHHGQ